MTTPVVNKFHTSKVYKIYSDLPELSGKCYVGSTTQRLSRRMVGHRTKCKDVNKQNTLYTLMRQYGVENFKIILIENVNCNDRDELRIKENQHIVALDCVNTGWNCNYSVLNIENKKQYNEQYQLDNKDTILQQKKQYYKANKDKILNYAKSYREVNRDIINTNHKQYYIQNKESLTQYKKEYVKLNKDKVQEWQKIWRSEHKDVMKQYNEQYQLDNKNAIKEQRKRYREANKELIKQKKKDYSVKVKNAGTFKCLICSITCGSNKDLNKHYTSKRHINNQTNQTDTTTTTPITV